MSKITDTTKMVRENPASFLAEALFGGTSNAIENMEKQGQTELVYGSQLPLRLNSFRNELEKYGLPFEHLPSDASYDKPLARPVYEKLGIQIGDIADSLFVDVSLPDGWKLQRTDHSMWSELLDEKGRKRGSIFYKAAFYDRDAFFNISQRFNVSTYEPSNEKGEIVKYGEHTHFATYIKDGGKPIEFIGVREEDSGSTASQDLNMKGVKYLNEKYPDWENPFAYWD